jgi:hypothetical protein
MCAESPRLGLADLLAPMSTEEFCARFWRIRHLLSRGAAARFAHLLSWTTFNRLLEQHWRETIRFRLTRNGRDLDPMVYTETRKTSRYVRPAAIAEQIRRGATLAFHAIDEVHPPLRKLAESFEAFFRADTNINVYAGCRAVRGLGLHCDHEDVFVLQLDGPKRWQLYGFDEGGGERQTQGSAEADEIRLDETLAPGDLLYVPRGCYHVALAQDVPTLHVTISVRTPNDGDFVRWLVDQRPHRELPPPDDGAAQSRFADQLGRTLREELAGDAKRRYFRGSANLKPRPTFSLPWSATPEGLPAGRDFRVRLIGAVHIEPGLDSGAMSLDLVWRSRRYRFPRSMRWIVEVLSATDPVGMPELLERLAGRLDEAAVRILLAMLVKNGIAAVA